MGEHYLPDSLPIPQPMDAGYDLPHFEGLKEGRLVIQRCRACGTWIWGPEHVCYHCLAWDPAWVEVEPKGQVYAWTRIWSPGSPSLRPATPYIAVLVELPQAGNVRMIGNLLGDRMQEVHIGDAVVGRFEHHQALDYRYSLLHWVKAQNHRSQTSGAS
jgi:uncharacterized protein